MACYFTSILYLLTFLSFVKSTLTSPLGFRMPMMHRNSPLSPFHNGNITTSDLIDTDKSRIQYLQASVSVINNEGNFQTPLSDESGLYLTFFYVGSSLNKAYVQLDTASHLTWIQCYPCDDCDNTDDLPFNPSQSATYESFPCDRFLCTKENYLHCTANNKCMFIIHYLDGSLVFGGVAKETFHISNNNGAFHNISNIIYGCAHFDKKFYEATANGILGLGRGSLSVLSQLSIYEFSYCLPPPDFEGYHPIRFGSEANITGRGAMFLAPADKFNYILMLEGISFGLKRLPIEVPGLYFGMFIDTGTTLTYLNPLGFAPLLKALDEAISLRKYKATKVFGENCYLGSLEDVAGFNVTFHFYANVDVTLSKRLFYTLGEYVCFGILPISDGSPEEYSILGTNAQINYNVGYDLFRREISFQATDCSVF